MAKKYHFYSDGQHGWLAVKRKELEDLGLIDKISSCSYQRGSTVYLEEDCDMALFHNAKGFTDLTYFERHYADRSMIRSYETFNPEVRNYAPGMRICYGTDYYTLREKLSYGRWKVESDGGSIYWMNAKQLSRAEVVA